VDTPFLNYFQNHPILFRLLQKIFQRLWLSARCDLYIWHFIFIFLLILSITSYECL
jgi:hypothetical protein